jgi:thiosulfate dehydrogenase
VTRARSDGLAGFAGLALLAAAAALGAGCGEAPADPPPPPAERGRALFASAALSPSRLDLFTCATCHDEVPATAAGAGLVKAGGAMAGVTSRPSFWGGQENDLLRSINDCRALFMEAQTPLDAADADADALYAYLASLTPGDADPVPFTVVRSIADLPRGDATSGQLLFARSCVACHGAMHSGAGRLDARVPVLPDETVAAHAGYSAAAQRLVFIEKIRHGGFLGYGGDMPPFSLEVLPDAAVSDILEALGVLGQ